MQKVRRVLALLLCLCMVIPFVNFPHAHAAGGNTNMTLTLDKDTVNVGETVTVVIENADVTATGVGLYLSFDKNLLECTEITGVDDDEYLGLYYSGRKGAATWIDATVGDTIDTTNSDGIFSFGIIQTKDTLYFEGIIATLTFTAKEAGTVTFVLNEDTAGSDAYTGIAATKTLTIKGNEPVHECTAGAVSYEKGTNGMHTKIVACADNCGENFSVTEEYCSGGAADCEHAAVCEFCGNSYGEAKGHGKTNGFRYEHTAGTDTHNVVCADCGKTVEEGVDCTFEEGSHVCKFACGNETECADRDNDHKCDVCGTELSKCGDKENDGDHDCDICGEPGITQCAGGTATCQAKAVCSDCGQEYGEKNLNNHVGTQITTYENKGENHTKIVKCECGTQISSETEKHQYEDGKCVCEAVEHVCAPAKYDDNGNGTHKVTCSCGDVINDAEAHAYNETTHKCDCGNIETFELTIFAIDFANGDEVPYANPVTVMVPFGAKLVDYIPESYYGEQNTLYRPGDIVHVDGMMYDGTYTVGAFIVLVDEEWVDININEMTMPAESLELNQDTVYTGWHHEYYDYQAGEWIDERIGTEYLVDGELVNGWCNIDGAWYYFDYNEEQLAYYRTEGISRVPYPTVAINGVTYAPNADDLAYAQANADSKYTDAETAVFVFGADGKFQQTTGIVDGNRYAVNGMIGWHVGLVEVDGEYYYFIGDVNGGGNIAAEGDTYLTRINGIDGFESKEIYNFEGGKFSGLNGQIDRYGDGVLYYYENSKLMVGNGLTKIGDQYVYVRSTNGQIVVGTKWWVAKTNDDNIQPGLYTFDENGYLQTAKDPNVNGLVEGIYYKNGMPYYAGLIEINGDIYYINSAGEAVTGTYYITKLDNYTGSLEFNRGDKLTFDADGKLVTE